MREDLSKRLTQLLEIDKVLFLNEKIPYFELETQEMKVSKKNVIVSALIKKTNLNQAVSANKWTELSVQKTHSRISEFMFPIKSKSRTVKL